MNDDPRTRPRLGLARDDAVIEYQALSGLAVGTLALGFLSAAAILDPWCWTFPILSLALGAVALWRIARRDPAIAGRKAALVGMGLALVFGGTALGRWAVEQYALRQQARRFAQDFFACLAHGQPQLAYQFLRRPIDRPPLESNLWAEFRKNPEEEERLRKWVENPTIKTLLLLGQKATVRYCATAQTWKQAGRSGVNQIFSVTYDDPKNGRITFYVELALRRDVLERLAQAPWTILSIQGGARPHGTVEDASTGA